MTTKRDYYEILGLSRDASESEIKAAYRKLALKYHPDRNPGDKSAEDNFKEAAEAYEVIHDPQKRNIYDQYGHQGIEGTGFSGVGGFNDIFSSFGDIFEDFFGFNTPGGSGTRMQRGSDLRYNLNLSFMDAAFGKNTKIKVEKMEACTTCSGTGCESGTQPETCSYCKGTGQVSRSQGFFTVRTTCPSCHGQGQSTPHPCADCNGKGQIMAGKMVSVKIPAGVDSGSRLRLTGEGEAGLYGGPPGDLYVFIIVEPHELFERQDTNIICRIPISFVQAALGDETMVPTLKDKKNLKIPKGTQPGDILRFPGLGITSLRNGHRGDQIMQITIKTPTKLSKKQEELLRDFAKLESGKLSSKLKKMFKGDHSKASG